MLFGKHKNKLVSIVTAGMLFLFVMAAYSVAATPAGTLIVPPTFNMQYSDGAGSTVSRDALSTLQTSVNAIYGLAVSPQVQPTASVNFNDTAYFNQVLTNAGNTTDDLQFTLDSLTGGWSATVYNDDDRDGIHDMGEVTVISTPISMSGGATRSVFVALTAPATYISPAKVVFHPQTVGTPVGIYTGYNGTIYGGVPTATVTENALISDAVSPSITPVTPTANQQNVPNTSMVVFDITDAESGISFNTLIVTVNGTKYSPVASASITNGFRVTIDPSDFAYFTTINVQVEIRDLAGNRQNLSYDFKSAAQASQINLTAFLHGYYNTSTKVHRAATINVQMRPTRNVNAGVSVDVALNASGNAGTFGMTMTPGSYYLTVWQQLPGLSKGVNHVVFVSSESVTVLDGAVTTLNISEPSSSYYIRPFVPRTGYTPILLENAVYLIKGGDATGERIINVTDIVRWNNAATNPNSDQRGDSSWSEDANFDGDPYMNTDDFSIWNKNKGQNVPLPEEDL